MSAVLPVSLQVYGSVFVFTRLPDAAGLSFIIQEKPGPVKKNIPGEYRTFFWRSRPIRPAYSRHIRN